MTFLKKKDENEMGQCLCIYYRDEDFFLRKKYNFINYKPFGELHHFLY